MTYTWNRRTPGSFPAAPSRLAAENSGPVFLMRYMSGTMVTMGHYPSAQSAMLSSDEPVWYQIGDREWHSHDGRSVIEPGPEV